MSDIINQTRREDSMYIFWNTTLCYFHFIVNSINYCNLVYMTCYGRKNRLVNLVCLQVSQVCLLPQTFPRYFTLRSPSDSRETDLIQVYSLIQYLQYIMATSQGYLTVIQYYNAIWKHFTTSLWNACIFWTIQQVGNLSSRMWRKSIWRHIFRSVSWF
jgi:hypothetical protein